MKRSTLILGLIICVVGVGVGLLITRFFGSRTVGEAVSFQTPRPMTATPVPTAFLENTPATPTSEPTSAPTQVAATATKVLSATSTVPARTNTVQSTATRAPAGTSTTGETFVYVVKAGDSLKSIASDNNVSVEDILALNTISNPDSLVIGQELQLPRAP